MLRKSIALLWAVVCTVWTWPKRRGNPEGLEILHGEISKIVTNVSASGSSAIQNPSGIVSGKADGFLLAGKRTSSKSLEQKIRVLHRLQKVPFMMFGDKAITMKRKAIALTLPCKLPDKRLKTGNELFHVPVKTLFGNHDFLAISAMDGKSFAFQKPSSEPALQTLGRRLNHIYLLLKASSTNSGKHA